MSRTVVDLQDELVKRGVRLTGLTKKVELVKLKVLQGTCFLEIRPLGSWCDLRWFAELL